SSAAIVVLVQLALILPFCYRCAAAALRPELTVLREAAASLGAPPAMVLRRVLLPQLVPALRASLALGFALSLGAATGISINTAHELGHKTDRFERWLAKITLAPVAYGHFYVEHNRGHHVRVATAEDPASARYGESFWAFLPRTVTGSI
ncbi:fatty acid desaturase, partial [Bacillus licheniformis]|nr:fatty acid desaturase [Bacillus licheniformis]